jgi:hypothetical protein
MVMVMVSLAQQHAGAAAAAAPRCVFSALCWNFYVHTDGTPILRQQLEARTARLEIVAKMDLPA